ncbi:MAG: DNA polymerase IV [Parcubacteria group bacterium]|nr:DNA polymerase IV [Parcubacteria group bacterium]
MERIILHIDFNSYFASVEQQANPFLRGKPIGITGKSQERSVVATASIEAKALGVKTAMSTWEAKKVCPTIILWPGDPEKYSDITSRFNRILSEFTPNVSQFSVDESFLDITDEAEDYFGATCLAQALRERLREEFGDHITASIGIAPNKLMAKLACESVKPNGLTVVRKDDLIDFIDTRELDDLCGIGHRIKHRLNALGVETFKQLREFPINDLVDEFKSYGTWLHAAAHGHDSSAVVSSTQKGIRTMHSTGVKSYGHSYTLPQNTHDLLVIKRYLLGLADKVAWRMRRDKTLARRVSVFVRFGDFTGHGEQRTFNEPTANGLKLFQIAWRILSPHLSPHSHPQPTGRARDTDIGTTLSRPTSDRSQSSYQGLGSPPNDLVRLVGLSTSLLSSGPEQPPLFKKDRKMISVFSSLDKLQHRYGPGVWQRASTMPIEFKSRSSGFNYDHEV